MIMRKFLTISIAFFLLFFGAVFYAHEHWGTFSGWIQESDYYFHFTKAKGECPANYYTQDFCVNYPPLYSILSSFFVWNEWAFNLLPMFILIFVIPSIIYHRTRSEWSLLIYFSSSIVFNIIFASVFAQMLSMVFFTIVLSFKKFDLLRDGILSLLAVLSHREAIFVMGALILFKVFREKIDEIKFSRAMPLLGLSFSGKPDDHVGALYLFLFAPAINWIYSLKLSFSKILFIAFFFVGGIVVNYRVLLFIPILWAFWLPEIIQRFHPKERKFVVFLYLSWMFLQFVYFAYTTTVSH